MSVDEIFREVENRALADFNCRCASQKLGHWPSAGEAMLYFLSTPQGHKDALNFIGAVEYPVNTDVPPEARRT